MSFTDMSHDFYLKVGGIDGLRATNIVDVQYRLLVCRMIRTMPVSSYTAKKQLPS